MSQEREKNTRYKYPPTHAGFQAILNANKTPLMEINFQIQTKAPYNIVISLVASDTLHLLVPLISQSTMHTLSTSIPLPKKWSNRRHPPTLKWLCTSKIINSIAVTGINQIQHPVKRIVELHSHSQNPSPTKPTKPSPLFEFSHFAQP